MNILNGFVKTSISGDWININRIRKFSIEETINNKYRICGHDGEKSFMWYFSEEYETKDRAEYYLEDALRKAEPYFGRE